MSEMKKQESPRVSKRRGEIFAAAAGVFAEKGYALATVDEIAVAAGISKGSIYNYFESKQDLFWQLFHSSISQDSAQIEALALEAGKSAREKIDQQLENWFERFGEYQKIGRLVLEFWLTAARDDGGEFSDIFQSLYANWRTQLGVIFAQGEKEGLFQLDHGPAGAAAMLMGLLDGLNIQCIIGVRPPVTRDELRIIKNTVFDALRPDPVAGMQEKAL